MNVVMDLGGEAICWLATRQAGGGDKVEDAANEGADNEEAGGSTDMYHGISRGDFQV